MDTTTATTATIAVPATIVLVLTYAFQMLKPALELLPGLRPSDGSHDDGLRLVYALLSFAAVLVYALGTSGAPADMTGWLNLVVSVGATAVTMTVGGHYLYQKVSAGGTAPSSTPIENDPTAPTPGPAPADFPPAAPSVAALGLPEAA